MSPLDCAEEQFAAYNERDLDRFLACFADDVHSFRLPEMTPLLSGKAAYGEFYATQRFNHTGLRAELVNRIVMGNTVIDHELIHGLSDAPLETAIMFVVEDGLIKTVFSIPFKSAS